MATVQIQCCLCGAPMTFNAFRMCIACLQTKVSITESLPDELPLFYCSGCDRYKRPPWATAAWESSELMQLCLSRIKELKGFKLVDAAFIWTEPHSKRIKLRLTVETNYQGVDLSQNHVVTFVINDLQCPECKKSYTPHTWMARIQIRQKVNHKRTFFHLEQLIMKNRAQKDCIGIELKPNGVDFHFAQKGHATKMLNFVRGVVPVTVRQSQELISQDIRSNTANYKFTFAMEILPICRDDLVALPDKQRLPGLGMLVLCYKVTSQIHLIDPLNLHTAELKIEKYWKQPFTSYVTREQLVEFIVLDIGETVDTGGEFVKAEIEVARAEDENFGEETFRIRTHLGRILKVGDSALGYDITRLVHHSYVYDLYDPAHWPDVVLVRKLNPKIKKKRKNIVRIADLGNDEEFEEFLNEEEEPSEDILPEEEAPAEDILPEEEAPAEREPEEAPEEREEPSEQLT